MKLKKEFAILFFIIAVLVFYIYSEKGDKTHYDLPDVEKIKTEDISKLNIRKQDSEIVLIRENDTWLVGPKKFPADSSIVDRMLEGISGLTLTALASESRNYSIYELDEKHRIDVDTYKGNELIRKVSIGKPAPSYRHTFILLDEDHRVFHANGNIKSDFDKKMSDLRDKKVMSFNEDILEIVLKKDREELTIIRRTAPLSVDVTDQKEGEQETEDTGPKWTTADGKAVKENEVEGIINTLSNFVADSFIEEKTKEDLQSPVFTATLKGVNAYTISLFTKNDNQYPAVSSGSEYPFLISEWKANKIMKDINTLVLNE